ncbi:DUF2939 domain-containing protein [Entomobacter blattae]|uniref:DUF2939 domain-containing protein n=1 Tax=Entomobacter blattae TaxID=2762277 RepID=A0A7H1NPG1_9PROT|nr:DUF2939 domain-containing protein [Entomobacter blattae]QNT77671.1 hypothetical protein JGUZn3_04210 [Entomobacter blattae]
MLRSHLPIFFTGRLRPALLGIGSRKRKTLVVSVSALIAASSLYLVSPYFALWSIASAVENNDMPTLGKSINWHSLCDSLQGQASTMLSNTYGIHTVSEDSADLPDFGSSFATKAVSNAIKIRVTQENLGTIVKQFFPTETNSTPKTPSAHQGMHMNGFAHFISPTTFIVDVSVPGHENETPMEIEMKIQKWRWKIVKILLPTPNKKSNRVMEASANSIHS